MTNYRQEEAFLPNGERNPYYPNPIVPDAIHHGPIHENFPPRPRTVTVEENNKVAEIKDAFKNLRFKVSLTSFDSYYFPGKKCYQIQVLSFNAYADPSYTDPIIIVDRPTSCEPPIHDYDYALKLYDDYVRTYTQLIKAETKDFQDIELYKEQIGYKIIAPSCCLTCKWCKKHCFDIESKVGAFGRLECWNPKCCKAYNFDSEHRHQPFNEHCHDPKCYDPNYFERKHMIIDIHPNVDMFGICDNYEKNM